MNELNMTLVKNIENKINDCTSASQLRKVFNIYRVYLYNEEIKEKFDSRIEYLKLNVVDDFTSSILENFIEDYEDEIERQRNCSNAPKKNKAGRRSHEPLEARSELSISLQVDSCEGKLYRDTFRELVKIAIYKSMGNRNEAARILGLSKSKLAKIINKNSSLKKYMKDVKKDVKKMTGYDR